MDQRDGRGNKEGCREPRKRKNIGIDRKSRSKKNEDGHHIAYKMQNGAGEFQSKELVSKGLRTQLVLSLILVVISSQKSSPLPLP